MNLNRLVQNRMCELMDCKPGEEDIGEIRSDRNFEQANKLFIELSKNGFKNKQNDWDVNEVSPIIGI